MLFQYARPKMSICSLDKVHKVFEEKKIYLYVSGKSLCKDKTAMPYIVISIALGLRCETSNLLSTHRHAVTITKFDPNYGC